MLSVFARLILEALQRHRKSRGCELPTVLVMDEAHNFITRNRSDHETLSAKDSCREVFDKIAREGRKFGLGLVISSQRPSELSPTVLAQCNTFLLHRLVNDEDQSLVRKLVPDTLSYLLKELSNGKRRCPDSPGHCPALQKRHSGPSHRSAWPETSGIRNPEPTEALHSET